MPIYEYRCVKCGEQFELYQAMSEKHESVRHDCGNIAFRVWNPPALQTDTNFMFSGQYDNRLCRNRDDKIEGRKDFQRRLDEKNLQVIDNSVFDKKQVLPEPCM